MADPTTPTKPRAKAGRNVVDQDSPGRPSVLRKHGDEGRTEGAQDPPRPSDARRVGGAGTPESFSRDLRRRREGAQKSTLGAGMLALDPGQTKNGEGRVVVLTADLVVLLTEQVERAKALERKAERIVPALFLQSGGFT